MVQNHMNEQNRINRVKATIDIGIAAARLLASRKTGGRVRRRYSCRKRCEVWMVDSEARLGLPCTVRGSLYSTSTARSCQTHPSTLSSQCRCYPVSFQRSRRYLPRRGDQRLAAAGQNRMQPVVYVHQVEQSHLTCGRAHPSIGNKVRFELP